MDFRRLVLTLWTAMLGACQQVPPDCGSLSADTRQGNAGCMILQNDRLLMVQQRVTGLWSMPGGTAEPGERAVCTAQRETREETGLAVLPVHWITTFDNGFHLYRCRVDEGADAGSADTLEIADWRWLSEAERDEVDWRFADQQPMINRLVQEQVLQQH